jgi:hypothetical protein
MQELSLQEIEMVDGGIQMRQFALGVALVGIGIVAGAAVPFMAAGAGAYGIAVGAGVLGAGGGWLISVS